MTEIRETDFALDESLTVDFDPLEAFGFDDAEDEEAGILAEGPYSMPNPEAAPSFQRDLVSFANGETATERIEALFAQMPTLQRMLFAILDACASPVATADLETTITAMKQHHHSVYEPLTLCNLLKRAGAIEETDEEGTPLTAVEQEPTQVEVDGVAYWRVTPAPEVFWSLTEAGTAQRDSYRPLEMIANLFAEEPQYADIFTTCLTLCSHGDGTTLGAIGNVVDDEPVLQNPKRYAMYFIDKLEHAGAVEWKGQWAITEAGRTYLAGMNEE